eukprot:TRINITY_DN7727_c0_g1_i1.p1 TRINITY_DN7727_c0_g1~~TRINITY_DN7727_c0_g1_i1.p1  ORF type:complete len:744 (-),score=246.38 TRINITY_DN7727_c0_g1_i1:171-2402(-)
MAHQKRVAILTSGGDAPGMNAAIRAVVRIAIQNNCKIFAVYEGYEGLVSGDLRELTWDSVGGTLNMGGTFIGTARSTEFRKPEGRKIAAYNLMKNCIDSLIVVGGDGSLTGADIFRSEWLNHLSDLAKEGKIPEEHIKTYGRLTIVGLVGSIDNDFYGTTSTIGSDTALHRIMDAADMIISTALSHRRNFILEVMGRDCGYLALLAALATGCEYVFIPEAPPQPGWEEEMCAKLAEGRKHGRRCSFVIVAEGARDVNGKPITSTYVKQIVENSLKFETRITVLGHVQRGGSPTAFDRFMSTRVGVEAAKLAIDPEMAGKSVVVGTKGNTIVHFDLLESVAKTKEISKLIAEKKFDEAIKRRGKEFLECHQMLNILGKLEPTKFSTPGLRIAVMNVGAPAAGMNPCVRGFVRLCMDRGHTVLRIKEGFVGLTEGNVEPFGWMDVTGWVVQGGCNIGTNRKQLNAANAAAVASTIKKFNIQVVVLIGGWDGYISTLNSSKLVTTYPELNIPFLCIPASVSNNLPGTEYSIGCDTALNNIQSAIDKIKQSAVGTRRVYFVEVMGATCGYLALASGLITGAERVYLHEEGITLDSLRDDINTTIERFKRPDKQLAIMVVNEKASPTYTTHFLQKIYQEEGKDFWEVRESILGHLQQGGTPTIIDRISASRFALHCCQFICDNKDKLTAELSGCFGVGEGEIIFTPINQIASQIDFETRRPKNPWWMSFKADAETLGQSGPVSKSSSK